MITSVSNPQIKNLIQLQNKSKARQEQKAFVAEGIKMFEESKEGGYLIKAYMGETLYEQWESERPDLLGGYPYEVVSDAVFKSVADTLTPQGILCLVKKPEYTLDTLLNNPKANILLLEDIRDPGNLGTMVRTAEGAGFNGIILTKSSVDMYNPKVIRSTMGAIYRMPFLYTEDFQETLKLLKESGITIYAAHLDGAEYYDKVSYTSKCAIMIGNEANGISPEAAGMSDQCIKIPMEGSVESLNAAVAAAVLMYEVYRQKRLND